MLRLRRCEWIGRIERIARVRSNERRRSGGLELGWQVAEAGGRREGAVRQQSGRQQVEEERAEEAVAAWEAAGWV